MIERLLPAAARRARSRGRARRRLLRFAGPAIGIVLGLVIPAAALAHPLGNFTINHFAALRVSADRIALDVVIDRAEIPAFQEQQRLDANRNGALEPAELAGQGAAGCAALVQDLRLTVAGTRADLRLFAAGLSQPPGAGGLTTMRLVCEYEAVCPAPITSATTITYEDRSFTDRIGWREIVVLGDGMTIDDDAHASDPLGAGTSRRLTSYPTDLLTQPLDVRSISVAVSPGGPAMPAWQPPDATPVAGATRPSVSGPAVDAIGAVPGGVRAELAGLIDVRDLTPLAILVSLAIAFMLGVIHAVSPGHGKTIMAAYLVAGRGSSRQAVGLGLAVTVSHTLGVLVLAGLTLAAASFLPPERLYPVLGVASGGLVILIGASLLWQRLRAIRTGGHGHDHADGHGHPHGHDHVHGHDHGHEHPHPHERPQAAPASDADSISWRGLIALGLSGGLVPSASALILLLGSIAAGRVGYGVVLVFGFGLGMAVVLAGIGLLFVHARRLVERRMVDGRSPIARLQRLTVPVQVATAGLVVVLGVVLTGQALTQVL